MQGTILKPSPNPQLVFKHRLRSHVADPAQTLCSPLKTIFESIKCVAKPFPSSNISIDKNNQRSWHILQDSMFPRRGPSPARVLKDMIASARSHPVEEKPEWWWRTLACLPYLMNFYDHRTWTYAYQISSSNPSPLLNMWESCTFPLIFSISRLPPAIISGYKAAEAMAPLPEAARHDSDTHRGDRAGHRDHKWVLPILVLPTAFLVCSQHWVSDD